MHPNGSPDPRLFLSVLTFVVEAEMFHHLSDGLLGKPGPDYHVSLWVNYNIL